MRLFVDYASLFYLPSIEIVNLEEFSRIELWIICDFFLFTFFSA